ncbi:hypothetical protein BD310DRAFT_941250 [Dichomitus squalens]|uniref:DUF6533 domain-containing protein n=1 Tax=Dichomitus squalens TaxID=114155 RepID=A0A4Q9PB89_9APHY|nr:hypothetical protein BD310DRAFT_941250 [Dichomitus squalens]
MPLAELSYPISIEISNYATVAIIVVVIYECLITIDREVNFAWNGWSRQVSWARCVFLLNRYLTILLCVTGCIQISSTFKTALK